MIEKIVFGLLFCAVLGAAALIDIRNREIPNLFPAFLLLLGFTRLLATGLSLTTFISAIAGALIAGLPLLIGAVKTNGIGGGDIKFAACGGFFMGLFGSCSAFLFSLILFLLFSILYIKVKRLDWKATSLPYAPFYWFASVVVYFLALF